MSSPRFVGLSYDETVEMVSSGIIAALLGKREVLWLTSGGSNVGLQVDVIQVLRRLVGDKLARLIILPADERYGLSGHSDSNYLAMKNAGFSPGAANWPDILAKNADFATTTKMYNDLVEATTKTHTVVATLGLGTDGHTAGILPHSPALDSPDFVAGYEANYMRMTLTPHALRRISAAYLVALGESKLTVVDQLKRGQDSVVDMPAMLLYDLEDCTVVYDID